MQTDLDQATSQLISDFVSWGVKLNAFDALEIPYRENLVLHHLGVEKFISGLHGTQNQAISELTDQLQKLGASNQRFDANASWSSDAWRAALLDIITPSPTTLNSNFKRDYTVSAKQATDRFYELSRQIENVKVQAIAHNIAYTVNTNFGDIEITINLSKPEKTTAEIEAAGRAKKIAYPPTVLDQYNEGFYGRLGAAARSTHRFIYEEIGGQTWGWHYSPYAYYSEHAIFVEMERQPMHITKQTFANLLAWIDRYPHYFIGSNADLPIVGGSILSQEHFQGGRHTFAMMKAPVRQKIDLPQFESVSAGVLHWPMSVIKLSSHYQAELIDAAELVRQTWQGYSDSDLMINAYSNENEQQHTVTPIAWQEGGKYQLALVLRDNGRSTDFPDGIFHPHQAVQHIKQENIGLIEVMGLAILPGRLKNELADVADVLLGRRELRQIATKHQPWVKSLMTVGGCTPENVESRIQEAIGQVFIQVLSDAGVYKNTDQGREGFDRFIAQLH